MDANKRPPHPPPYPRCGREPQAAWRGRRRRGSAMCHKKKIGHVRNGRLSSAHDCKVLKERTRRDFMLVICMTGRNRCKRARVWSRGGKLVAPNGVYFVATIISNLATTAISARRAAAGVARLQPIECRSGRFDRLSECHNGARRAQPPCVGPTRNRRGSRPARSCDARNRHTEIGGGGRRFSATIGHNAPAEQFVPWSWMARRITAVWYGLSDREDEVFTSSGEGTWGPPLRLGSNPEL